MTTQVRRIIIRPAPGHPDQYHIGTVARSEAGLSVLVRRVNVNCKRLSTFIEKVQRVFVAAVDQWNPHLGPYVHVEDVNFDDIADDRLSTAERALVSLHTSWLDLCETEIEVEP